MGQHDLPLANVITFGTKNLQRQRDFYVAVGWPVVLQEVDYVAFELGGAVLALFPAAKLAADGGAQAEHGGFGIRLTIAVVVDSPDHVDSFVERVRQAGGHVSKAPTDAEYFAGRSAYIADPEGNYWEVLWAPPENPIVAAARRAAGR